MVAFAILLTYGLQLTVTADLAWQGLRSKLVGTTEEGSGDGQEEAKDEEEWTPKLTLYYYCMRLVLILGSSKLPGGLPVGGRTSLLSSLFVLSYLEIIIVHNNIIMSYDM